MIKKAILKAFDSGTYKATVQIVGSLSVWLEGVPVSTAIAASDMVVGRTCAVLFFDESNPNDAVIISVHGGSPISGGSGAWELIGAITLTQDSGSVSFSNLSTDYNAFNLLALVRRSTFGSPIAAGMLFNDDSGSNYIARVLIVDSSGVHTELWENQAFAAAGVFDNTNYGLAIIYIQNRQAVVSKEWLAFAGLGSSTLRHYAGRWNNTSSKITIITITPVIGSLLAGSHFVLEGSRQ